LNLCVKKGDIQDAETLQLGNAGTPRYWFGRQNVTHEMNRHYWKLRRRQIIYYRGVIAKAEHSRHETRIVIYL
jgi:hypothetical protein